MIFSIDASVFVRPDKAIGNINGSLNFSSTPTIGSKISFSSPLYKTDGMHHTTLGLKVEAIIHSPTLDEEKPPILMLEDAVFDSMEDAKIFIECLEQGFKIYFDQYMD